jgi:hypothetical protein
LSIVTLKIYFVYWCYKTWRDYSKHIQQKSTAISTTASIANASTANGSAGFQPASEKVNEDVSVDAIGIESGFAEPSAVKELGFFEALAPRHLSSFENMSPHLRMLGMLVPYVNDYLFFTLLLGIAKRHPNSKNVIAKHPLLWSVFLSLFAFALFPLSWLPGALYLLFLLSAIPIFWAQSVVNEYWDKEERGQTFIVRQAFTGKEIVVTIAGALYLGFVITGFIIGANK